MVRGATKSGDVIMGATGAGLHNAAASTAPESGLGPLVRAAADR
jgi:hypothetical protein